MDADGGVKQGAAGGSQASQLRVRALEDALEAKQEELDALCEEAQEEVHQAEQAGIARAKELEVELAAKTARVADLESQLEDAKTTAAADVELAQYELTSLSEEVDTLNAALNTAARARVGGEDELATLRSKLRQVTASLADTREEACALRASLSAKASDSKALEEATREAAAAQAEAAAAKEAAAAAHAALKSMQGKLVDAEAAGAALRDSVAAATAKVQRLQGELQESHNRETKAAADIEALKARVAKLDAAKLTTAQVTAIKAMKDELDALKRAAESPAEAEEATKELEANLAAATRELEATKQELAATRTRRADSPPALPENSGAAPRAPSFADKKRAALRTLTNMPAAAPAKRTALAAVEPTAAPPATKPATKPQLSLLSNDTPGDCAQQ